MPTTTTRNWTLLLVANGLVWGMLSFYQAGSAAPPAAGTAFGNATLQRQEIIRELQEIKTLLSEQTMLLRKQQAGAAAHERPSNPVRP